MGDEEAADLVRRVADLDLGADAIHALVDRTEGWPAGLQLAAQSLIGHDDADEFVRTFSGDDRNVADYLTDEVLARQPEDIRQFLIDTSVLDRMSGPLCDAVTGRTNSQGILANLDRSNVFIVPLDDKRTWFRYHTLLRDRLRYELGANRPASHAGPADSRRGSGTWRDELELGGQYIVATEDWDAVVGLARRYGRTLFERGEPTIVVEWLAQVPYQLLRSSTDALLLWLGALVLVGRTLEVDDERPRPRTARGSRHGRCRSSTLRATMVEWHVSPECAVEAGKRASKLLGATASDDWAFEVFGLGSRSSPPVSSSSCPWDARSRSSVIVANRARCLVNAAAQAEGTNRVWLTHAPRRGSPAWKLAKGN